jgi:uncharacterized protein (TIGR00251 family)
MPFRISALVRPRAKHEIVTRLSDGNYRVTVRAPAQDGKANLALIELLAQHFCVRKSAIRIVRGQSARQKLIEINAEPPGLV